ncbi:MAG TPA: S9 family peptidase [Allosphingosinicella sp.]|nr:S9 family peptidase [Allosphingosinicella sp.]
MFRRIFAATALLFLVGAAPPADPPAAFGVRERVLGIAMSPGGTKIAFITPGPGQSTVLYTVDAAGGSAPQRAVAADGKPERLRECAWVSEDRLICSIYFVLDKFLPNQPIDGTRLVALNADGTGAKLLSRKVGANDLYLSTFGGEVIDWLPGSDGAVLMGRVYVPESRIGSHFEEKKKGYGVDRIDTRSLAGKAVEQPDDHASNYISDGRGNVRIMETYDVAGATGYLSGKFNYFYRTKASREWKPLSTYNVNTFEGLRPVAVDPDLDIAYAFRKDAAGRWILVGISLDGSKRETLVLEHPQVDVDDTIRIGRARRVVGASFATDRRQAVYFDKPLAALGRSLSKALPGLPLVSFVDSSEDESKLLLFAGSDTDPGRYYVFDKKTKTLNEIMLARPELENVQLASVKPVTYRASDGTEVPAYLTLPAGSSGKNVPAIVMPHGGPSARDEWGFDWLAQFFASRGYAVLQPNYRGSSGYGDAWYQKNGFQSWRSAIGDVNDAGRWLIAQGIADPNKLAIFGWSYGGYAALQANVLDPKLFKAAVAVAPVTDLATMIQDSLYWSSHRIVRNFIGTGPHLKEGSPAENAGKIVAPVLLFHGDRDMNVGIRQSRIMADRLKDAGHPAELVVYPNLDHYLEDSSARIDMLRRSDAFLRQALKIQ